jgi:hypothetical protein
MNKRISLLTIIPILLVASISSAEGEVGDVWTIVGGEYHLSVTHENAFYNCVQDSIGYDTYLDGHTLHIWENEIPAGGYADCMCYFDIQKDFWNLEAGEWTIVVNWLDHPTLTIMQEIYYATVTGAAMTNIVQGATEQSDCLEDPASNDHLEWGRIKAMYR